MKIFLENFLKRNQFSVLVLFIILLGCNQPEDTSQQSPPNVILIMADDMGFECLGTYGSAEYKTPVLDKMAQEGVKFNQAYSQPLCTPSRVKIMTGKHNFRNYSHFGYLNPQEKTFGNLFQAAGYKTMIAGKWQLNGIYHDLPGNQDNTRPFEFGFDEYCLWQVTKQKKNGERFADPLIEQNGELISNLEGQYGPDIFTDYILNFIDQNQDSAFFIYYPMVLVHDPFVVTPDSEEWGSIENRYQQDTSYFADMMEYTDKLVGKIFDKLRETGLEENTFVIFTADNGTHVTINSSMEDGREIQGAKGSTIEYGFRVPMIAKWPGKIQTGSEVDHLIDFNDILPTITEVADINLTDFSTDGRSFLPLLMGQDYTPKEHLYIFYEPKWGKWKGRSEYAFNQDYKLYADGSFYHIAVDKLEKNPISFESATEEQRQVWNQLKEVIEEKQSDQEVKISARLTN